MLCPRAAASTKGPYRKLLHGYGTFLVIHDIGSNTISSKRRLVECDNWSTRRLVGYDSWSKFRRILDKMHLY